MYETIAILILRMLAEQRPIGPVVIDRFQAIFEEMKRRHWWLTGPDDFPACALLTGREEPAKQIGEVIESIYTALRGVGCASGNALQTAANILYLARLDPDAMTPREALDALYALKGLLP